MKKALLIAATVLFLLSAVLSLSAEGDKNRGDEGKGGVVQVHVRHSDEGTPAY